MKHTIHIISDFTFDFLGVGANSDHGCKFPNFHFELLFYKFQKCLLEKLQFQF